MYRITFDWEIAGRQSAIEFKNLLTTSSAFGARFLAVSGSKSPDSDSGAMVVATNSQQVSSDTQACAATCIRYIIIPLFALEIMVNDCSYN